ncbi:Homeobox protein ARX [Temnothorax longispinosus]|uniref:Homeobox protein ARX n=1 Tax=Temnothorax longispinosus TaxID=300112 RepID=A0A4S2KI84_9HYME|nr:Homeobox protein ARX [Temnothorax longispinosus]
MAKNAKLPAADSDRKRFRVKPRQKGSVTRLHGGICAVHRQSDRRLVVYERSRVVHWLRDRDLMRDRVPDTRLAARKRQDPEGDSLEGFSIEWFPSTSRGERRQMRTRYTMYRTAPNNNLCGHVWPQKYLLLFQGGRVSHERGVSLQVYEAASSSRAHATGLSPTRSLWTPDTDADFYRYFITGQQKNP